MIFGESKGIFKHLCSTESKLKKFVLKLFMPILNPVEAYHLAHYTPERRCDIYQLLQLYLPMASKHLFEDFRRFDIHDQFVEYLKSMFKTESQSYILSFDKNNSQLKSFLLLSDLLECPNVYELLSDPKHPNSYNFQRTQYRVPPSNIPMGIRQRRFFIAYSYHPNTDARNAPPKRYCTLLISDPTANKDSLAVLSILDYANLPKQTLIDIHFACYVLAACGYYLVLTYTNQNVRGTSIPSICQTGLFSEIHLFDDQETSYLLPDSQFNIMQDPSFYYIYSTYKAYGERSETQNPYLQYILFSAHLSDLFATSKSTFDEFVSLDITSNFTFELKDLNISVCNVPVFNSPNEIQEFSPAKGLISYGKLSYPNTSLFRVWGGERIGFAPDTQLDTYFIDYSDIHLINPQFYIKSPIYLANISDETMRDIHEIRDNATINTNALLKRIKKHLKHRISHDHFVPRIQYTMNKLFQKSGAKIDPRLNQIYSIYEAIHFLTKPRKKGTEPSLLGPVFQVQTGEGKTFIIQAIAHVLAASKKTSKKESFKVHVVTSNIRLSCRDFENIGSKFNRAKKIKAAMLLHENEVPDNSALFPQENPSDFYHHKRFENAMNMNECVMTDSNVRIIFSTLMNFEAYYLKRAQYQRGQADKELANTYLIVDEADTVLIDELTNGTILSKPLNSNATEILSVIFKHHQENLSTEEILGKLKESFLECRSYTEKDLNEILKDLETSLTYHEGDRYIIKKVQKPYKKKRKDKVRFYTECTIVPFDSKHKGIDEPNKEFSGFVHQFIAIKEAAKNKEPHTKFVVKPLTMNSHFISHPLYVRRYKNVIGLTGTIGNSHDKDTFTNHYKLQPIYIPRNSHNLQINLADIITTDIEERNRRICDEVQFFHKKRNPCLVIFQNSTEIEPVKKQLIDQYHIPANKINTFDGTTDQATALETYGGQDSAITLGTNYCGRGMDIKCNKSLHVIVSFSPQNSRSVEQAFGRAARNGKPGTTRIICTKESFISKLSKTSANNVEKILSFYEINTIKWVKFITNFTQNRDWIFTTISDSLADLKKAPKLNKDQIHQLNQAYINVNRLVAYNYKFPISLDYMTFINIQCQRIYSLKNCPECIYTWRLFQRYVEELLLESWALLTAEMQKAYISQLQYHEKTGMMPYGEFLDGAISQFQTLLESRFGCPVNTNSYVETFMNIHKYVHNTYHDKVYLDYPQALPASSILSKHLFFRIKFGFYPFHLVKNSGSRIASDSIFSEGMDVPADPINTTEKDIQFIESLAIDDDDEDDEEGEDTVFQQTANIFKGTSTPNTRNFIVDPELQFVKVDGTNKVIASITKPIDMIFESICQDIDASFNDMCGLRLYISRTLGGLEFGIGTDAGFDDIQYDSSTILFDKHPMLLLTIKCKSYAPILAGVLLMVLSIATVVLARIYSFNFKKCIKTILKLLRKLLFKFIKNQLKKLALEKFRELINKIIELIRKWTKWNLWQPNNPLTIGLKFVKKKILAQIKEQIRAFAKDDIMTSVRGVIQSIVNMMGKDDDEIDPDDDEDEQAGSAGDDIKVKITNKITFRSSFQAILNLLIPMKLIYQITILSLCYLATLFINFQAKRALKKKNKSCEALTTEYTQEEKNATTESKSISEPPKLIKPIEQFTTVKTLSTECATLLNPPAGSELVIPEDIRPLLNEPGAPPAPIRRIAMSPA